MTGLPGSMANGPSRSNHLGEEPQIWERPWTLDEMRQTSANWSLAADSGLFLYLQDFSQRMLSKTHDIEKQLDGLIRDTKATDCCLHSVFNDFLMLSNTQFIENRVYDEEVEEPAPKAEALERQPEQEKTREQKEAELIPKMQEAVNYGLSVLDSAFEQLDIKAGNSDSEDEEAADRVEAILEPKDLYVDRPLPYLIGSQAFMEQDDVGLGDLSSDEMSIDSDRDSVVESEDGKEAVQSDEDFDPEEDEGHGSIKKKSSMLSYEDDEEEDEESDIFGESDKEEEDDDKRNTGSSSFADELAARIKGEPASKPEADRASLSSKKKSKGKKEQKAAKPPAVEDDSDDLFKPPKMEDEDFSPFGGRGGLFSGGRGLFDDDDEGDLFSDAPKSPVVEEKTKPITTPSEPAKAAKKTPSSGGSMFPDNSLFGSGNDSDSVESRENGSPAKPRTQPAPKQTPKLAPKQAPIGGGGGGGGLFDDEDEEDDFFSGKSLKKSSSAGPDRAKPKKAAVDLFGGDDEDEDEDGDIFSESTGPAPPAQSRKEAVEEQLKAPEKKMPAGAISMFGPGTKSLLTEGLKRRQPSPSEESERSEENVPPEAVKAPAKPTGKPHSRGLFSDDEDTPQVFPIPRSQSKPEPTKTPLSIFDDEEEEDLFASVAKSKPAQAKATTPQPKKTTASSLFSDDEDQWLSSDPGAGGRPEAKAAGGMKPSASAPSGLRSAKTPQKDGLFDRDDDLFAATKESSQKKPQRVALLFEDEGDHDEDKGSLFGVPAATGPSATDSRGSAGSSATPSLFDSHPPEEASSPGAATAEDKPAVVVVEEKKIPETQRPPSPPGGSDTRKKPAGAVSLFGGIAVLPVKRTESPADATAAHGEDDFLSRDSPPPFVATKEEEEEEKKKKEEKEEGEGEKVEKNILSLFDDHDQEEDSDWTAPISIPSQPAAKNTLKPAEERLRTKSTGVFVDEELLFSSAQQKDNDPEVDIFSSGKDGSAKPAVPTLFADEDEDDLFSAVKPKAPPPRVAEKPSKPKEEAAPKPVSPAPPPAEVEKPAPSAVKSKDPSTRIGKLQANLLINPAALLPGAAPRIPGAVGVLPGLARAPSPGGSFSSASPSPVTTPVGAQSAGEEGVSFDGPAQVTTLQSANKGRAKGSVRRRPQSRASRQQSVQSSTEEADDGPQSSPPSSLPAAGRPRPNPTPTPTPNSTSDAASSSPSQPRPTGVPPRPSVLTLPASVKRDSPPPLDEDDLFSSDGLFESTSTPVGKSPAPTTKTAPPTDGGGGGGGGAASNKEKEKGASLFDDQGGDLFQKVKPKSSKKAKALSAPQQDDDDDIFGVNNSSSSSTAGRDTKTSSGFAKQDIFQDEVAAVPKAHRKHKDRSLDASLFHDNVDIFADLTTSSKPKEKSKKKAETKSIFDDDMDDIFSASSAKAVTKAPHKSKKRPSQDASEEPGSIFDDPLHALGGN